MATTIHRAPTRGARTSWEGAGAQSVTVAQHRGVRPAPSLLTAQHQGTPWPGAAALARARGSGHPLRALPRPGAPPERG